MQHVTDFPLLPICMGILMTSAQYQDYSICVWAPKEHSMILDYLLSTFGGKISKANGQRYRWILEDEKLDDLVSYLKEYMPQCEGRSKFLKWAKDKYEI